METVQDFIEAYYPNYTNCSDITYLDDLYKILHGEITGTAKKIFETMKLEKPHWISEEDKEEIILIDLQDEIDAIEHKIFKKSIEGYINSLSTN